MDMVWDADNIVSTRFPKVSILLIQSQTKLPK